MVRDRHARWLTEGLGGSAPHDAIGGRPRIGPCVISNLIYYCRRVAATDKPLVWLVGKVATPPLSKDARIEAGCLLRRLQQGQRLSMPHSRPMPSIGRRCHELRIDDSTRTWRIIYRIDTDAVVIACVFEKKTGTTPKRRIAESRQRLKQYDADSRSQRDR